MHTIFISSCLCNFQQMIRLNYHRRIEVSLSRFFNVFRNFSDVLHYCDILKLAYSKEQANRTWIPLNQQYRKKNWKPVHIHWIRWSFTGRALLYRQRVPMSIRASLREPNFLCALQHSVQLAYATMGVRSVE